MGYVPFCIEVLRKPRKNAALESQKIVLRMVVFASWEVRTCDESDAVTDLGYYARYGTLSAGEKEVLDKAAVIVLSLGLGMLLKLIFR